MKKLFLLIFFTFIAFSINAQWSNNSAVNNAVAVQPGSKQYPAMCSDGSGGAIIAWMDFDIGNYAIYVQRINSNGIIQWQADGISVSASQSTSPEIVSDGVGGAIIVWTTGSINNENIYAQRISGAGAKQWAANGVTICNAANTQNTTSIIADGNNGAIIVWKDERAISPDAEIYTQKINGNGNIQWAANGVKISTSSEYMQVPKLVLDGAGGAIIAWANTNDDICCQRINSNGVVQWTVNGVVMSNAVGTNREVDITTDGSGGAIISWESNTFGGLEYDIYARRILNNGSAQWTVNGELICFAQYNQNNPRIIAGSSGSAIITWHDARAGSDIYAQKINGNGVIAWTQDGIAVCNYQAMQANPVIATDGSGGAIITWDDRRNGAAEADLYAQRIDGAGVAYWLLDGAAVCTATDIQENYKIIADGSGGAIITWDDYRSGNATPKIYAQRITSYGALAIANDDIETANQISIFPNPSNGVFSIQSNFDYLNMTVRNMLGQIVYSKLLTDLNNKINIAHIPSGIYSIELASLMRQKNFQLLKR